ncbi:MAG: major capsid protein [Caulobacter sp.]|nr:major capsid protein [Caulobacter sp.]
MSLANVFNSDLFGMTALTAAINASETPPGRLAELGLFEEKGETTTSVVIERKGSTLSIVPSKPRGGDPTPMSTNGRTGISLNIPHVPARDRLLADEIQNVRAFGSDNELEGVAQRRDEKLMNMNLALDNTEEYHRLGAIQGLILDADGGTIYDLFDEFGVTEPDTVFLDLEAAWASTDGGVIRGKLQDVKTNIRKALKNSISISSLWAPCGDEFFKLISNHPEIRETYMAQQAANDLRNSGANDSFTYGGVTFELYPGYGDVELPEDECRFVPMGVPGLFISRYAPAPWFSAVNSIGLPRYAMATPDPTGEKYIDLEAQTNGLHICTRPEVLFTGSKAAS